MSRLFSKLRLSVALLLALPALATAAVPSAPGADHHQHLFSRSPKLTHS